MPRFSAQFPDAMGEPAKIAFAMVGLPARGKSFIARKLARYLAWVGYRTRVFNVGEYRRQHLGHYPGHAFFDPDNDEALVERKRMAQLALEDMLSWLDMQGLDMQGGDMQGGDMQGGDMQGGVAIYDATNTTIARRQLLLNTCDRANVPLVFVECICDDDAMVEANVVGTKMRSPDYRNEANKHAAADFRRRIQHYERVYDPIVDERLSFIQLINAGRRTIFNRISGEVPTRVAGFLTNLRASNPTLFLTRHGESEFNLVRRIGGDASLSQNGQHFARSLAHYFENVAPLTIWTSTLQRTRQTVATLSRPSFAWQALSEIDAGICDGMTYKEIEAQMPKEYAARAANKLSYRYPRGESYKDVVTRLDPLIAELERHPDPLLIVAHQAVLRVLYAYLRGTPVKDCTVLDIPLHTLIKLTPNAYGCDEHRIPLDPRPKNASSPS